MKVSTETLKSVTDGSAMGYFTDAQMVNLGKSAKDSVLAFPSAESVSSQKSSVSTAADLAFPHAPAFKVGMTVDVIPKIDDGQIKQYDISLLNVSFGGFKDSKGTQPVINEFHFHTALQAAYVNHGYFCFEITPKSAAKATTYDADGRRMASVADANERQLLFVKITRG